MTAEKPSSSSCSYSGGLPRSKNFATSLVQRLSDAVWRLTHETGDLIHEWTPFMLVASYFTFSICLYTFCSQRLIEMFWFFYLTTNFYISGGTVLEALMSLGPCRDGRSAVRQIQENNWVFPTPNNELVFLDLLIVSYIHLRVSTRLISPGGLSAE